MSDFHPETCAAPEAGRHTLPLAGASDGAPARPRALPRRRWVPAWSVASILNGVLSFMLESTPTVGSVEASLAERRRLAVASHAFNRKVPLFCELFPELVTQMDAAEPEAAEPDADGAAANAAQPPPPQRDQPALGAYLAIGVVVALAVGLGYLVREL